jgi:hypothetical protein
MWGEIGWRGYRENRGVMNIFILTVVTVSRSYAYIHAYKIVHFKYVQSKVCQLYFNKSAI